MTTFIISYNGIIQIQCINNDVANMLHISLRTLQDWRDNGRIAYIQISGKVLYKERDIRQLLEDNYCIIFKD